MRGTGAAFVEVLAEAQKLGYAEADPSFDVDGIDAAHKLAILTSVAFGTEVDFAGVYIEGIRHVSPLDIEYAEELGYRIKLLAIARRTENGIEQRVHPCMVRDSAPIAHVEGVFNAVVVEGDFVGSTVYEGRGAGAGPTASAVVADLVDLARGRRMPAFVVPAAALAGGRIADGPAPRRLLYAADGGRPAGRDRRYCGRVARRERLAGIDAAARPLAGRGGAGRADHPRGGGGGDAPRAPAHRAARRGGRAAAHDPDRRFVRKAP